MNLNDTTRKTQLPENDTCQKPGECTTMVTTPQQQHYMVKAVYQWSLPNEQVAANMAFNLPNSSLMMAPLHGSSSYGPQRGHLGTVFQGNC